MTEKKMTESEIMKALKECEDCHYFNECEKSTRLALDLINQKNAEIELLENESKRQATKAIKEFVERVKAKHRRIMDYDEAGFGCQILIVEETYIDKIAKEMGVEL